MPIYEYTCAACGHAFDHFARTLQDKPAACPACGAKKLHKEWSSFAPAVASAAPPACGGCAQQGGACPAAHTGCGCGACGCGGH